MQNFQRVYVVDQDGTRRAYLSKLAYDAGIHAEPSQDLEEFEHSTRHDGIVLCADDSSADLIARVHHISNFSNSCLPIMAYSANPTAAQIVKATLAGAVDYLVWPIDADTLRKACSIGSDQLKLTDLRARQALARKSIAMLSHRELGVLKLITQGHANKEIARILNISHRTVEVHRANFYAKLNLRNSTDAVRLGIYAGLDELD